MKKDQLKGGISAMFGDGSQLAPKAMKLTDEEYEILEIESEEEFDAAAAEFDSIMEEENEE